MPRTVVVIALLVVVAAAVSWFALRTPAEEPPTARTPSPTASASTTPPVVLDEIAGLPPTQPLPAGLLERTTADWVLAVYSSVPAGAVPTDDVDAEEDVDVQRDAVAHTVVLASPTGELFRVVDLPARAEVSLLRWEAGSATALVWDDSLGDVGPRAVLDLVSGEITPQPLPADLSGGYPSFHVGEAADGAQLWSEATSSDAFTSDVFRVVGEDAQMVGGIGTSGLLDPTRRWLATEPPYAAEQFDVLDVVSGGTATYPYGVSGQTCDVVGWLDTGRLLVFCVDEGASRAEADDLVSLHATYRQVDITGPEPTTSLLRTLGPSDPRPAWDLDGVSTGPGTLAFVGTLDAVGDDTSCAERAYLWSGRGVTPIDVAPGSTHLRLRSGPTLMVESWDGCAEDVSPATLHSYDIATGTTTVLATEPTVTAAVPRWASGLTSWVAPTP